MRRIPSIFGFSNHIHRNIPNDAFMDLEVIKHHLPELLDLRELLLHLSYEDPEPVVEGKCLLKEDTETFIPIYFKVNLSFREGYNGEVVPNNIKEKFQSLTLEDWSKMFKDFNNPCALAPQIKGDLICLPVPFESCLKRYDTKYIPIENPIKDIIKVEKEGSIYNTTASYFSNKELGIRALIEDGYSAKKLFNVFDLDISVRPNVGTETNSGTPIYKYAEYQVLTDTSGIDLDLTPVTFTKLVRNEE